MSNAEILKEAIELLKATKGKINTAYLLGEVYEKLKKLRDEKK